MLASIRQRIGRGKTITWDIDKPPRQAYVLVNPDDGELARHDVLCYRIDKDVDGNGYAWDAENGVHSQIQDAMKYESIGGYSGKLFKPSEVLTKLKGESNV